jgi:hypothetical protein
MSVKKKVQIVLVIHAIVLIELFALAQVVHQVLVEHIDQSVEVIQDVTHSLRLSRLLTT